MKTTKITKTAAVAFISIALATSGCNQTEVNQANQLEANLKMYESVWDDVMNKGKIDEINTTHFTDDVVAVMSPDSAIGLENFKAYYNNYLTGFSDIVFTFDDAFGQGEKIAKHWHFKGKHTGEFFGIPPTGKIVEVEGVTLVKMRGDKIAMEQDFMDNSVFMQQLGLVSDPNNLNVIDGLYNAFSVGDMPAVLGAMDDNIEWREAEGNVYADGNPYIGPDAVLKGVFARIGADHEYFKLIDVELHEMSDNQVLATLRYDAQYKKNKAKYNAQVAHLWTLNEGKITAFQQYTNTRLIADAAKK